MFPKRLHNVEEIPLETLQKFLLELEIGSLKTLEIDSLHNWKQLSNG